MTKLLRVVAETVRSGSGEIVQIVEPVPDNAPATRAERFAALEREVKQLDDANAKLARQLGVGRRNGNTERREFIAADGSGRVTVHNIPVTHETMPPRPPPHNGLTIETQAAAANARAEIHYLESAHDMHGLVPGDLNAQQRVQNLQRMLEDYARNRQLQRV